MTWIKFNRLIEILLGQWPFLLIFINFTYTKISLLALFYAKWFLIALKSFGVVIESLLCVAHFKINLMLWRIDLNCFLIACYCLSEFLELTMCHSFVAICHHKIFLHLNCRFKTSYLLPNSSCCFHHCVFANLNSLIKPLLCCTSLNDWRMLIESKRFCLHAPGLELKLLYHFIGQQNSYIEIFWFICYFCCYAASMNSNYTNLTYLWFALTFDVEDGTSALSWEGGDAMDDLFFPISDLYDSIFLFD